MIETAIKYQDLIAPCGMNCGLCIGHLREKKPCGGCFAKNDKNKPKNCRSCSIVNCESLKKTASGFCYECPSFPCNRLKNLDKRYRTNYGMSMLKNLDFIDKYGLDKFLLNEEKRWTCKTCGQGLCVHRKYCLNCKTEFTKMQLED